MAVLSRNEACDGQTQRCPFLSKALTHPALPLWLAIVSVLLTLPSLTVGWVADDHFHRLRILGSPKLPEVPSGGKDLFAFADGNPERIRRYMDRGLWPWWAVPHIRASFWRPLTVWTHRLDYSLWPDRPVLMHAHSITWLAALTAVTTVLYRRILGVTWTAGLAALFYCIDDARGMPVGFLANRNAIVSAFFGMLAILAHHRWRTRGSNAAASLASLLLLASLLSSEAGVGTVAYLAAYALCLEQGSWRRGLLTLLPYAVVLAGWRAAWTWTGHGIKGVGLYVDPLTEPIRFLWEAIQRAPILLLGQLGFPPSDLYLIALMFGFVVVLWLMAVLFLIWFGVALWPLLRCDRVAWFWTVGMVLALVPICATFASDRMLFFVGLGAFGLLSQFLTGAVRPPGVGDEIHVPNVPSSVLKPRRRWGTRSLPIFLLIVHGFVAPVGLLARSAMPVGPKSIMASMLVQTLMDESVEHQTVVLVTAPVAFATTYLPVTRALDGLPVPAQVRLLAPYQPPVVVTRPDSRTLVIRPKDGYLKHPLDQLARGPAYPMELHQVVTLIGMTAEVNSLTEDGRPESVTFRFDVSLEDPCLRWLNWTGHDYEGFTVPAIGESVSLP